MKISLLVPTRERLQGIGRLLNSIVSCTKNLQDIEILFGTDEDDIYTHQFLNVINHQQLYPTLNISYYKRPRSEFINRDYYNWLAAFAKGDYIWAVADDLVFLVPEWDKLILEKAETYLADKPDRIVCLGIKDNTPKPKVTLPQFPCFPMITKEAYNFFGFILHPQIPTWGADYLLYLLYTGAKRYLEICDYVYLEHISWHTKAVEEDKISSRIRTIFGRLQHVQQHNVDYNARTTIPQQVDQLISHLRALEQGKT
jgi:glycosyltransferase involved in cell wall biosynthesis